jgi:excisionase family DNA binding protein
MTEVHTTMAKELSNPSNLSKSSSKFKHSINSPQFLSTAEAARMLGLSTTLVQTLVDQGDLKGWKTRGGHRRISLDSILDYQNVSRYVVGTNHKQTSKPKVSVVIESASSFDDLQRDCLLWSMPIEVNFFGSVTEALLDLSSHRPDMMVVEMSVPREQQQKTFQALENFNQRGHTQLSVVLITSEKSLSSITPSGVNSSIQVVSGPLSSIWLHAYLTGILATYRF